MAQVRLETVPELIQKAGEIRKDICRCARYAGNVHFGGPLSATDITVALYYKYLGFDPEDVEKPDRNMFVLSKGHNGVLLYCIFCDMGMYPWEELLDNYNKIGHTFGAHPNRKYVKGIEVSTGSLGHGLNWSVGFAHANRNEGINSRIFCLLGDGEMEEGSNWEAIMYAASHNLSNIVAIVDNNHCSASFMSGENIKWNTMADCWRAFGWDVREIDGTNMYEIDKVLSELPPVDFSKPGKPVCIISNTTKGQGLSYMMERPYAWHIGGLDDDKLAESEALIDQYTAEQLQRRVKMAGFTFNITDMSAMMNAKDVVTKKIVELVKTNPKVCYINSDGTGHSGPIRDIYEQYPDRVLDVGIAEMNLVTVAAAMAKKGYIPFGQTFGPFLCVRALDQIHNDLAYNDLPVRLIGTHGGISSGYGPTHNTIVEFGIMNSIPNMTMIAPCDGTQCVKMLEASLTYPGPIYVRIPRGEEPVVYNDTDYDYQIGKAIEVKTGKDATIIATGTGVYNSLQAALQLQEQGLDVAVLDMHTIKPIDKEAIVKAALATHNLITVEDHNILGGLGSIVADVIMEAGVPARLKKIGIPDEFVSFGYPEELYPYYGFDGPGIAKTVLEFCK